MVRRSRIEPASSHAHSGPETSWAFDLSKQCSVATLSGFVTGRTADSLTVTASGKPGLSLALASATFGAQGIPERGQGHSLVEINPY